MSTTKPDKVRVKVYEVIESTILVDANVRMEKRHNGVSYNNCLKGRALRQLGRLDRILSKTVIKTRCFCTGEAPEQITINESTQTGNKEVWQPET